MDCYAIEMYVQKQQANTARISVFQLAIHPSFCICPEMAGVGPYGPPKSFTVSAYS